MANKENVLSARECRLVVKRYLQSDEFEVLQYGEEELSSTGGPEEATVFRIKVKILVDGTEQDVKFIAKHLPPDSEQQTKENFGKEIYVHEFLFKCIKDKYPSFENDFVRTFCFAKDDALIVFEDLSGQGFILPKNPNTLDLDHIKITLQTLAKYHAGCIGYEEAKSKILGNRFEQNTALQGILQSRWFHARLKTLTSLIDLIPQQDLKAEKFKKRLCKLAEQCLEIAKPKRTFRNVLCHGSMWGDNVLFKYEKGAPIKCKLLNFESQHYNPPALDVLHFIYRTTTTKTRQQHLHKLLQFYYDSLKSELSKGNLDIDKLLPLEEDFRTSIHHLLPLIKLEIACFRQIQALNPEFRPSEDGTQIITEAFKADEKYRKIITESVFELKDLVTHPGLTLEDCFKIIENKIRTTNYKLLNYEINPLGKMSGYLGDHNRLKINIDRDNRRQTLNLFAKFMPKQSAASQIVADIAACYKEIFYYQRVIPLLRSFDINIVDDFAVPCYFTRHDDVMIFEDFGVLNYKCLDPREPFSYEIVCIVMKKLAKLHASSIILEEKLSEQTKTNYCLNDHYQKELEECLFVRNKNHQGARLIRTGIKGVHHLLSLFPDPGSPVSEEDMMVKVEKAYEMFPDFVKQSNEFRNVICHGDLWVSNILVKFENDKPIDSRLIDFQICRYCPPAQDILTFIYLTTTRSFRKQHFLEVLNLYHSELSTTLSDYGFNGDHIYPYESFMKSIEYMTPQAVCQTAIWNQLALINQDVIKEFMTNEETATSMILEDRTSFITAMFDRDPLFRERAGECVQDLREMCIKYF